MRKTTSLRLLAEIKEHIARNGSGAYVEGCVLIVHLLGLDSSARNVSLSYEQTKNRGLDCVQLDTVNVWDEIPPIPTLRLAARDKVEAIKDLIVTLEDIPSDLPPKIREAVEGLLNAFSDDDNPL